MLFRRRLPKAPRDLRVAMHADLMSAAPTASWCKEWPTNERCLPETLWFPEQSVWLRITDLHISGDSSYGFARYRLGWLDSFVFTAAIRRFRERWDD